MQIQPFLKIDNIYVLVYLYSISFHQYSQVTILFQLSLRLLWLSLPVTWQRNKAKPSCIDVSHWNFTAAYISNLHIPYILLMCNICNKCLFSPKDQIKNGIVYQMVV